jgi:hypothetical protein
METSKRLQYQGLLFAANIVIHWLVITRWEMAIAPTDQR